MTGLEVRIGIEGVRFVVEMDGFRESDSVSVDRLGLPVYESYVAPDLLLLLEAACGM